MKQKRLRIFAGPNGSGKSTLVGHVTSEFKINFGFFVNADEIEKQLQSSGKFNFSATKLVLSQNDWLEFARKSSLVERAGQSDWLEKIALKNQQFEINQLEINSYHAALLADFLREKLLADGQTFTFETVLSDAQKLLFLKKALANGYRVYLYFVATDNPKINLIRVQNRVLEGGHDVPVEKIFSRYEKTLALLPQVLKLTHRAYLFDNSVKLEFVAEITDGKVLTFENGEIPVWIKRLFG